LHPGLTTIREFPKELGVHLAEFVLRRINQPDLAPQQLVMPTELIRRESIRHIGPGHSYLSPLALQENVL
jgi:LacI family transcriptional regulator